MEADEARSIYLSFCCTFSLMTSKIEKAAIQTYEPNLLQVPTAE